MRKQTFNTTALLLLTIAPHLLVGCKDVKEDAVSYVKENLQYTVENPNSIKILGVSEPDSAFGISYFTAKEIDGVVSLINKVGDTILKRTNNMSKFDPKDDYVLQLADRQMTAMNDMRELTMQSKVKGKWMGWKVKIDFQYTNNEGKVIKTERWYFLDKEAKQVIKTLDLPLP